MTSQDRSLADLRTFAPSARSLARLSDPVRAAQTVGDLRLIAKRKVPRSVFDYVDGAAEDGVGLAEARAAWSGVRFHPQTMRDVSQIDASTDLLGVRSELPLVLAPVGFLGLMHRAAELGAAAAAARAGLPFTVSTLATTSVGDVAAANPDARTWFQLYLSKDPELNDALLESARSAGVDTLVLTADTAVSGARFVDYRNGLTIPPALTRRTLVGMASRPRWAMRIVRDPLTYANFPAGSKKTAAYGEPFAPQLTADDVVRLRAQWQGRLVVKGIQRPDDAVRAVDLGADAVVLSHHGGRQLDRVPPPLLMVPEVVQKVGDRAEVFVDSGITNGADIVAAVAAGATGCLIGRAYVFGLMAGGEAGVDRAISMLLRPGDILRTMALLGATSVADLNPDLVTLPEALTRAQSARSTTVIPDVVAGGSSPRAPLGPPRAR